MFYSYSAGIAVSVKALKYFYINQETNVLFSILYQVSSSRFISIPMSVLPDF